VHNESTASGATTAALSLVDQVTTITVRRYDDDRSSGRGHLPDAIIDGRRVARGENAAGVLLYDQTGTERGGYVTFDGSNVVGLTLDNHGNQAAIFAAGPDPGDGATRTRAPRERGA